MPTLYYIRDQRAPPTSWRLELEQYYIILSLFIGGWGSSGQGATPHPSHAKSPCQSAHCTEPGGICLQPSKIFIQGLPMHTIYLLFIHYFIIKTKGILAILVIELGPLWLSLHVTLGVLINITPCRLLGQAVLSTMCLFVLSLWWNQVQKIKSKQCIVSSNNNAKTIVTSHQSVKYWHSKSKSVCGQLLNVKFLFLNVLNEIWENCWEISQK